MPKNHADSPRPPRWMRPYTPPPPSTDPDHIPSYPGCISRAEHGYIVRSRLENGYWCYRPGRIDDMVRQSLAAEPNLRKHKIPWGGYYPRPTDAQVREAVMAVPEGRRIWLRERFYTSGDGPVGLLKGGTTSRKEGPAPGKVESRRTKGGRRMKLRDDDQVGSGMELARGEDQLPSDEWRRTRLRGDRGRGVLVITREEKEVEDLRKVVRESEGADVEMVREEPVYSVRVVPRRRKGKRGGVVRDDVEEGSWDEILEELDAQGWVPVNGWAQGEMEDELVSISTESWIMAEGAD